MIHHQHQAFNICQSYGRLNSFVEAIIQDAQEFNNVIDHKLLDDTMDLSHQATTQGKNPTYDLQPHPNSQKLPQTKSTSGQCPIPTTDAHNENYIGQGSDEESETVKKYPKIHLIKKTGTNKRNKVVSYICQRRLVEAFFQLKFPNVFEFSSHKNSRVLKLTFRSVFIRWLADKQLLPEKFGKLGCEDLMLIQRLVTLYIKENHGHQCSFQGKHYTAGFNQPYIFQNVTHILEYQPNSKVLATLKTVLSDGEIYISGMYNIKSLAQLTRCEKIKDFDLLKIQGTYEGASKPISISSLQILSQNHRGIYGKAPINLIDFLESRVIQQQAEDQKTMVLKQPESIVSSNQNQNIRDQNIEIVVEEKFPENPPQIEIDKPNAEEQRDIDIDKQRPGQNQVQEQPNIEIQRQVEKEPQFYNEPKDPEKNSPQQKPQNPFQPNKRNQRVQIQESVNQEPHKKLKTSQQEEEEEGEMDLRPNQPKNSLPKNQSFSHPQEITSSIEEIPKPTISLKKSNETSQKFPPKKIIEIDVFDLDMMSTRKETIHLPSQQITGRKQIRKSQLRVMESIFESEQKPDKIQKVQKPHQIDVQKPHTIETQKPPIIEAEPQPAEESITVVRSQTFNEPKVTPTKSQQTTLPSSPHPKHMGTTTQRKKIREEYNLLISNLYESNESFKIICRVNYLYEWRSKNDVPCLALDLIDSVGDEIKAIIYMNHSTKDCKECSSMIEVGKVYCFQNGQCKRDYFEKEGLQLVFNMKSKPIWGKEVVCGGKNKIIPTKIPIDPLIQDRVFSIQEVIQTFDSGKNSHTNVYGILEDIKISQYENKIKEPQNQRQEDSPEIQIIENNQNGHPQKSQAKIQIASNKTQPEGYTKLYLSGFLTDPLKMNKIFFTLVITKPKNQINETSREFLQKNMIRQGALVVLHNVKINSNNTNTVRKLEKSKKTYLQVITNERMTWKYNRQEFGAEIVVLPQNIDGSGLNSVFHEILSLSPIELQLVFQNKKFINYSQQPYTKRSIMQMNELLEKSVSPDESCFSELRDVKLHSIDQKPSVEICFYCKKKIKSPEKVAQEHSANDLSKYHCGRCKKIVKIITMHVFFMVFADNTGSFLVQVLKDDYIETILGMKVEKFLEMSEKEKVDHLMLIKYTDFILRVRSENKVGGVIHKITSIESYPVKAKIDEIRTEKKGVQKHYKTLESSW